MKKILSAILALSLLLCAAVFAASAEEKTKLVFWHSMSEEAGAALTAMVDRFNATAGAENGIEVEAVYQGAYADATQKLNSILSAQNYADLPDVMQMDATGKVAYLNSGKAYTVDDLKADDASADTGALLEAAMGNWNYSGVQLGVPFATSTTVMYYNKTLLDAAGAQVPATFADIAALKGRVADGTTIYATVPNTPTLANWIGQLGGYVVDNANGSEGRADHLACTQDGTLAAFLTEWKALYASGALVNQAGSSDEFVAGNLLLYTSSSSNVTSMKERIGGAFEMGVAAYPKVNDGASFGATVSGSCLVMFRTGKEAAAWIFEQYMTGAAAQADFAIATGYIPSNTGALETDAWKNLVAENPAYGVALDQLMNTPASMRSVTVGPSADFYYGIQNCVSEMLDEDLSVEETVDLMEDELGGLLTQYAQANP